MRFTPRTWSLLSVMLFTAAVFFWLKGNEVRDRQLKSRAAATNSQGAALELYSTQSVGTGISQLGGKSTVPAGANDSVDSLHLSNSSQTVAEMVWNDQSVLLVNASIDTSAKKELPIPAHLKASDPSAFIVQAKGAINAAFRSALREAGAEVVAYVPNNAYLVRAAGKDTAQLEALAGVQAVIPFEPYFKLHKKLLATAVNQTSLEQGMLLSVTLFPGLETEARAAIEAFAAEIVAEERSPFGPQLIIQPQLDALPGLARLEVVQAIEPVTRRVPASDITRVVLGVSSDSSDTNVNWLDLTGTNIWVNLNDIEVDTNHPALRGRVRAGHPEVVGTDNTGHGTFVAGLIVGDGSSAPAATNAQGSATNASFRGMAHEARLFALPIESDVAVQRHIIDSYLIETAARTNYLTLKRTNSLISNNSWVYAGTTDYDSSAARYDAATRDAVAGETGEQPVLYVFAAGNGGNGDDNGEGGTAGSIYSPGTAKNVLTVGALELARFITNSYETYTYETNDLDEVITTTNHVAPYLPATDSFDQVANFSSRGNVGIGLEGSYGRFKPDVVAPGTFLVSTRSRGWEVDDHYSTNQPDATFKDANAPLGDEYRYASGSTFAAATVSGMLALVQEFFEREAPEKLKQAPSPALLKALVINASQSLENYYDRNPNTLINYQGWGLPNLPRIIPMNLSTNGDTADKWSLRMIDQQATNSLATGQSKIWSFNLGTNAAFYPLRFSLVWSDPPGNPLVGVKLVNDLDLVVTNEETGFVWVGNDITSGSSVNRTRDPATVSNIVELVRDPINNVENVFIANPRQFGTKFKVIVKARRVNVNAVHDFVANDPAKNTNDVTQDFALVIASDWDRDPLPQDEPIIFRDFKGEDLLFEKFHVEKQLTNGIPLLAERVGANASIVSTNGITNQWNFYVFKNSDFTDVSGFVREAGTNIAFITFNPPNISSSRTIEADVDMYVSTDSNLTNLFPAVLGHTNTLRSVSQGGSELVTMTNGVLGQTYYVAIKSEDQKAAEFSLMGLSSDIPFDEEGDIVNIQLSPVPNIVPDGNPLRPGGAIMIGVCTSTRRVLSTEATTVITHENLGDLVGILQHNRTNVVLNNHSLNDGVFSGNNIILAYDDSPFSTRPRLGFRETDGPGNLNNFAGLQASGAWIFTMIDNAPGQTGFVQNASLRVRLMEKELLAGTVVEGTVNDFKVFPIEVPAGAVNLNVRLYDLNGPLEIYLNRGELASRSNYVFTTNNPVGSTGIEFDYGSTNNPPLSAGPWYLALVNPNPTVPVDFKLIILFDYEFSSDNQSAYDRFDLTLRDDALTNQISTFLMDKLLSSAEVAVRMDHPRLSDMEFHLVSPQGTRLLLQEQRGSLNDEGFGTTFVTNTPPVTNITFLRFTDNTNLALAPIKFTKPPLADPNPELVGPVDFFDFEAETDNFFAHDEITATGWKVITNVSFNLGEFDLYGGTNFVMLGNGGITRAIPTVPGRAYMVRFAYRAAMHLDLFSTGWNRTNALTPGDFDLHYSYFRNANSATYVGFSTYVPGSGFGVPDDDAFSRWITPTPEGSSTPPAGVYRFRTTFDLFGRSTNALITGAWVTRSAGLDILLNGKSLRLVNPGPGLMTPLSINTNFVSGLNVLEFVVTNRANDVVGLRARLQLSNNDYVDRNIEADSAYGSVGVEGILTNTYSGSDIWETSEFEFVARETNTVLKFYSPQVPGLWVDDIEIIDTGTKFALPEEPLKILQGERTLGDWTLEARDVRTGATNFAAEILQWRISLTFSDPDVFAERLSDGATYPTQTNVMQRPTITPGMLYTNQMHYFFVDTCPQTEVVNISFVGLGNTNRLMLLMDRSGLPTGNPERDDFQPIFNPEISGTNGYADVRLTATNVLGANFVPGQRLYFAVRNRFILDTNNYSLRVDLTPGNCIASQPSAMVLARGQRTSSMLSAFGANDATGEGELFAHTVESAGAPFTVSASSSDADIQILVSKGVPPVRGQATYSANASTVGSETVTISASSGVPLTPGTYYIRVVNNSDRPATFSIEAQSAEGLRIQPEVSHENNVFTLTFPTNPGARYRIESSTDLRNWITANELTASQTTTHYSFSDAPPADQARFFRVVKLD